MRRGVASDAPDKGLVGDLQAVDDALEGGGPVGGALRSWGLTC